MRLRSTITLHGSTAEVLALLGDRDFREAVARRSGADSAEAAVELDEDGGSVAVIDSRQSTGAMPALASRFLGPELAIHQEERWSADGRGALTVTIPGQPGRISGALTLAAEGGSTRLGVDADISVRIPLVGGKVESMLGQLLQHVLNVQEQVANERLA